MPSEPIDHRAILIVGNSHTAAVVHALRADGGADVKIINLNAPAAEGRRLAALNSGAIGRMNAPEVAFSMIGGNFHNAFGLVEHFVPFDFDAASASPDFATRALVHAEMIEQLFAKADGVGRIIARIKKLKSQLNVPLYHISSPPPVEDGGLLKLNPGAFAAKLASQAVSPAALRLKFYRLQTKLFREACEEHGVGFLDPPTQTVTADGFLRPEFMSQDPTHANPDYGALVLAQVRAILAEVRRGRPPMPTSSVAASAAAPNVGAPAPSPQITPRHPYVGQPDYQFWKREPAIKTPSMFDPVVRTSFTISQDEPVVTAGSCFAQHVARYLAKSGFNFLVTEEPHPMFDDDIRKKFNFGLFSARYGNIYTARQLKQLIQRAYGEFEPIDDRWIDPATGRVVDPFRPQVHPGGFVSEDELDADRRVHFAAIRRAFEQMSVFVFTLGLTEAWTDRRDGAIYPVAPGTVAGRYDPGMHSFHNFEVEEVCDDLQWSFERLRALNPDVRFIVTVSPVPLAATHIDRHVFVSTTYSKAVLRIAAERVCGLFRDCDYFPSYEIITSPFARGAYYAEDCREIEPAGVEHVMSCFLHHYGGAAPSMPRAESEAEARRREARTFAKTMSDAIELLCDEASLDNAA